MTSIGPEAKILERSIGTVQNNYGNTKVDNLVYVNVGILNVGLVLNIGIVKNIVKAKVIVGNNVLLPRFFYFFTGWFDTIVGTNNGTMTHITKVVRNIKSGVFNILKDLVEDCEY